ncbi:DUF1697 domain-containing protein [uncultured Methanobacterium sp.]|uniref:DUF1697 domain-containing protein n=1 Tax=uncultured Methanobacterium sp. TaxID=176306 RepID=UPI002AA7FA36|nr:DUF1697 domain-containing protein [uncultured Methanobacterium sp.]
MNTICYVAFLRGINVSGKTRIKMADLKDVFESMGCKNVRTLLASGNVVFDSEDENEKILTQKIQSGLKNVFNRDIAVILRSIGHLEKLQSLKPFEGIEVTPDIRMYVTFFSEKAQPRTISVPYTSPQKAFALLNATSMEVFSTVDISKGRGTPELMNFLEKEYGSNLTTRSWGTVLKLLN